MLLNLPLALFSFGGLSSVWPPVLMLGGLIFLHELGHFMAAKRMGMPVEVFSLGFGTRLLGFKWRETDVRLSLLPLGGYVKLAGFNPEEPGAEDPHGFLQQPVWKRQLFYSGGVIMNLLTAFALLWAVGVDGARADKPYAKPGSAMVVGEVVSGYPAAAAGLRPGDELRKLGPLGFPGSRWEDAVDYIKGHAGQPIPLQINREGKPLDLSVTPRLENGQGKIGLAPGAESFEFAKRAFKPADLWTGARFSARMMADMTKGVFAFLGQLVTFKAHSADVAGPIGIVRMSAQAAKAGWITFLTMTAFISLQLAILNLLPIPMLDGGHMAVLAWERVRGRDFTLEFKEKLFTGGFLFLAGLMALVIFLDVVKLRK
ncbi:MAG TPA: site-2 protease family protein [Holophagaceae bacterium]|nr:site-2 protease family protein [Holophagaceae bacterium]